MKWKSQIPIEATRIAAISVAVAEDWEKIAKRGLDQHPVGHVADATADPVAEGGQEAWIIAEPFFGIGENAGVKFGFAFRQRLEDARQHVHAAPCNAPGDDCAERPCGDAECPREREDARADHGTHDHAGQNEQRKLLLSFARHRFTPGFADERGVCGGADARTTLEIASLTGETTDVACGRGDFEAAIGFWRHFYSVLELLTMLTCNTQNCKSEPNCR
jgi:hypothetical protein